MKIFVTTAEYNPFHNGHQYHVRQMRQMGADAVVAVMSGNFVQRGQPACADKFERAAAAVRSGVDLIIELPVRWSLATAEDFAFGSLFLADALGCADTFCCGSESADDELLARCADVLLSQDYTEQLRRSIAQDKQRPFAVVRQEILQQMIGFAPVRPNDILAVEYLKAIRRLNSPLQFRTIRRLGDYHGNTSPQTGYKGAREIRRLLRAEDPETDKHLPQPVVQALRRLRAEGRFPADIQYAQRAILAFFRSAEPRPTRSQAEPSAIGQPTPHRPPEQPVPRQPFSPWSPDAQTPSSIDLQAPEVSRHAAGAQPLTGPYSESQCAEAQPFGRSPADRPDFSAPQCPGNPQPPAEPRYAKNPQHAFEEQSSSGPQRFSEPAGLWPRICRAGKTACSLEQLCRSAMARQFTLSAAQRTILSAFLQLPNRAELPPYLHVLALNRRGADVLKIAKKTAKLPILHNFTPQHLKDPSLRAAILAEQRADDLYALCLPQIGPTYTDFTRRCTCLETPESDNGNPDQESSEVLFPDF